MTSAAAFFMEFLGTTILCFVVMILTDERNGVAPSPGLYPLAMFVLFLGMGTSLGMTGAFYCFHSFIRTQVDGEL